MDGEEEQHSEFKNISYDKVRRNYLKRKFERNTELDLERHDLEDAKKVSKSRRTDPADSNYAGGPKHYNPTEDPDMYKNNCYLCFTKSHQEYPRFYGVLAEFLGFAKFDTIIDMMYQVFDLFINPHTLRPVEMTRACIREHVLHHMHEPLIEYYIQLERYKAARDLLYDAFVQSDGNGHYMFDYKAMATIEKINAKIVALLKEKPSEALFVNNEINIAGGGDF